MSADRFAVAAALREIAALLEVKGGNPFRARAYERGARAVEALSDDLSRLVQEGRLTSVPGIGAALASTIAELHQKGTTGQLEKLRAELPPGILELRRVPGLSTGRIAALHAALGIRSLEDLRQALEEGRVAEVKGFGEKTVQSLLHALDTLEDDVKPMLLPEAVQEGERLLAYLGEGPPARIELAGALRRRLELVDRLTVVVAGDDLEALAAHATRFPAARDFESREAPVLGGRLAPGHALEVLVVPPAALPAVLVQATGPAGHVQALAARAEERGLTLAAHALRKGARRLAVQSEAELYERLELPFIPPELRGEGPEVEAAARGELPLDLLAVEHVRGLVHAHTTWSDGKHTVEEMARAAEAMGLEYLTITDHSQSAFYAGGLDAERLRRQREEIDRVQESVKVRLLQGSEADILQDGAIDWPDDVLSRLDVVVASVHARHRLDRKAMTKRVVTAMRHPAFKIWGHALGRLLNSRPSFEVDMEAVLDAIAESRAAIEINGDPRRMELEPRWVREARARGIPLVISVDAHSTGALRNVRWAVDLARRGGAGPADVLNTRPVSAFARAVKPFA